MSSLNRVMLIGNLGRDPELRNTQSGQSVCEFSIATSERWTDGAGETKERTEWHRIIVWGKQGENSAKYLAKGRQVFVEGKLQTREWEDRDGNKRSTTEIVASNVVFLRGEGGADGGSGGGGGRSSSGGGRSGGSGAGSGGSGGRASEPPPAASGGDFSDDEIPF